MFKCQITNQNSRPGEKPTKIVTKTRLKTYYKMVRDEEGKLVQAINKFGQPIKEGEGWEIVEEKLVTEKGLDIHVRAKSLNENLRTYDGKLK